MFKGEHVLVVNVRVVHRLAYQVVPRSWQATSGVEVQLLIAGPKPNTNLTCLEQQCLPEHRGGLQHQRPVLPDTGLAERRATQPPRHVDVRMNPEATDEHPSLCP